MKVSILMVCACMLFPQPSSADAAPLKPDGNVYYEHGLNLLKANQRQAAIDSMKNAIDLEPENAEYYFALGLLYAARMSELSLLRATLLIRPAKDALMTAVKLDPQHARAQMALAELLLDIPSMTGDSREQAKAILNRLRSLDPASAAALEAKMEGSDADPGRVEKLLLQAVESKPGEAAFRLRLTRFYVDQRLYARAIQHGQQYLRMPKHWTDFPSDVNHAHLWLAIAYHGLGDQPGFQHHSRAVGIRDMPQRLRKDMERAYKKAGIDSY